MRLDKLLADMGMGTRSELKKIIKSGRVTVDGSVVTDPGTGVSAASAVMLDGAPVIYEEFVYYMINKPAGIISASNDPREATVVDLIDERTRRDLFPVGRLDRDTEGLILITNDGDLAHRLLSPRHHVDKTYYVRVSGRVTEEMIRDFASGITLPDGLVCMPADLEILGDDNALITIREGKFHQVKRMFAAAGCEVQYLKRLSMGSLELDESLAPGEYRRLSDAELDSLKDM